MYKVLSNNSAKTTVPELDLFSTPDTSVGAISSRYIECPLTNAITASGGSVPGPLEFRYNVQKGYLNLQKSYFQFVLDIRDAEGKVFDVKDDQVLPLSFCQMIGKTLFRQLVCSINGIVVEDSGPLYPFRSIIQTELNNSAMVKQTSLSLGGYAQDDLMDDPKSVGHMKRRAFLNKRGEGQFAATIDLNLFNQSRLLLNYKSNRPLVAYLNDPKFVIESLELDTDRKSDKKSYTYELLDIKLLLHEYQLHDSASNAIEGLLKTNKMVTYPLTNVQLRSFYVAPGRFDTPECRLLTSSLPKRVVMCMVSPDSYLGSYTKTTFNFQHFNIKDAFLDCGGEPFPRALSISILKRICICPRI